MYDDIIIKQVLVSVRKGLFDWLEGLHHTKDVLKYASTISGEQSVMMTGVTLMPQLSVDNYSTFHHLQVFLT